MLTGDQRGRREVRIKMTTRNYSHTLQEGPMHDDWLVTMKRGHHRLTESCRIQSMLLDFICKK